MSEDAGYSGMSEKSEIMLDLEKSSIMVKDGLHYGADMALYDCDDSYSHSKALLHLHRGDLPIKYLIRWNRVAVANNKSAIVALKTSNGYLYMSTRRVSNRTF